jgi:hypothetical protein
MSAVYRPAKKIVKGATKVVGEAFEEVIEKPTQKVLKETGKAVGIVPEMPDMPATTPEVTPEVTPEIVPDDTMLGRGTRRTKGKRAGAAGTLMEGYGVTYAAPSAKAPTGGSA